MTRNMTVLLGGWICAMSLWWGCAPDSQKSSGTQVAVEAGPPSPAICSAYKIDKQEEQLMLVYFGTYTKGREDGIFHYEFDPQTGALLPAGKTGAIVNPSFVALHPGGKFLYAVTEAGPGGGVVAYVIEEKTGDLTRLNEQPSGGGGACHVTVDPQGKTVVVANYGGGSVSSFSIRNDGSLGEPASFHQHAGSSVDPGRQKGPHAHSATFDPTGKFVIVADLGLDQLLVYRHDPATSVLTPNDPPFFKTDGGAGPRHFSFHPNGEFAYVINEMAATITALSWDGEVGTFESLQTVSTLPEGFDGRKSTAEIRVHPSGKFLYGSNRGHDSIAVFAIDPDTGKLAPKGHVSAGGEEPRNFNLDPTGNWLICAHQNSDSAQVFAVDAETGELSPVGEPVSVPMPVCVKFLPR